MKEKSRNLNIKPTPVCMNYTEVKENETQYGPISTDTVTKIYEAAYVHNDLYPGNPLIEAIPFPRTYKNIFMTCQRGLPGFNHAALVNMPAYKLKNIVSAYKNLHYVLPTQGTLEDIFYMSLVNSYAKRKFLQSPNCNIHAVIKDTKIETNRILLGDPADAAYSGFTLIGKSGCGKSSQLNDLLARYPQVLIHHDTKGNYFVQILYLVVNCTKKSNFRALYASIGKAIDIALGNTEPRYELELTCNNRDNLGMVNNKLRNIVERLCIGMIILDEFQNMNLDSSSENSMDSLLFIGNETKCVFGVVGTRFSKKFLNKLDDLKSRRRLGVEIPADSYTQNEKFVFEFIDWLFQYQIFTPYVEPTHEIKSALMECSVGIIDQIVSIFSFMNTDYIIKPENRKPVISADYVREIANKYFPSMQDILQKSTLTQREEDDLRDKRKAAQEELDALLFQINQMKNTVNTGNKTASVTNDVITIRDEAIAHITNLFGDQYNAAHIEESVIETIDSITNNGDEVSSMRVIKEAVERLKKGKSDRRPRNTNAALKDAKKGTLVDLDDILGLNS